MASKLLPATPRPRSHARTASLDSGGKALPIPKCVTANGGESTLKPMPERRALRPPNTEKRALASRGTQLHQVQDDHSKLKEQLALIEKSKSNLMQDLARAKRNVEELTTKLNGVNGTCKKDKPHTVEMETATFFEKEGWQVELDAMKQQYELALLELQTSKQAMETLKHELMVCVEAKDEAVRLAGEAMNAAESTARRVEALSAELFTTNGSVLAVDGTTSGMDDLIDDLSGVRDGLFEIDMPLREIPQETCERSEGENRAETFSFISTRAEVEDQKVEFAQVKDQETQFKDSISSLKALESELAAAKEAERRVSNDVLDLTSSLETLQTELAAAKEAEQRALNGMSVVQADIERVNLEAEKAKCAESAAHAFLAKVSRELQEAEEKLFRASVEDTTLVASIGFLKAELEKSQYNILEARNRESEANCKLAEMSECMEKMREANEKELLMCKEREMSAHARLESLQVDLERQKSEMELVAEKELIVTAKVADMIKEMEKSRSELIEHQKHYTYEIGALSVKLESNQAMLASLEEKDALNATRITSLLFDLEKKQSEIGDLQQRLSEMESEAKAISIELSALRESSIKLAELEAKEEDMNAKVAALNAEALGLKQALEEALNIGQAAREDLRNLEVSLQKSISDRDEARNELQAAYYQTEISKQIAMDALAEAQTSKADAERALEAMRTDSNAAIEELLIASKFAKEEAQMAREEARAAEEKLQAAIKHAEMASTDAEKIREEAQSAREDANLQEAALAVEKERASAAEKEAKTGLDEIVKLKMDLAKLQADALEARAAWTNAESRLQDAMEGLESYKSSSIKEESRVNRMSQEELSGLKDKLQVCEEQLIAVTNEAEALQMNNGELLRDLEAAKAEREASKRAVLEAHQHLADMEKAKRIMEADIQRLLDDSKLWKAPKDTRDILVLSEINGNGYILAADSREEKPQPDSPDRESFQDLSMTCLHIDGEERKEDLKEDLVVEKEEEIRVPLEEAPPRVVKKKKHALLHRLHSYLDKKKSSNPP